MLESSLHNGTSRPGDEGLEYLQVKTVQTLLLILFSFLCFLRRFSEIVIITLRKNAAVSLYCA